MQPLTGSSAITNGVRVTVTSQYLAEQSVPSDHRYVWAYTVRIANESERPVQLVSRHWIITDADEKVEEVKGPGVVGEQPQIAPGKTFQYTSGCMLQTPRGSMHGTYRIVVGGGDDFDAQIAPFSLSLPLSLN